MKGQFAKTAYRSCLIWGIFASMSVAVCTFVDALLIGNFVGSDGLAVSAIMTPVFLLFSLLGVTVAMGANVLISRNIGAGNVKEANVLMGKQLMIGLTISAVLLVTTLLFSDPILRFLGAQGELFPYAKDYLMPVFLASPFFILYQILSFSVRTDGNSKLSAAASGVVIVVNLSLDLLFMGPLQFGIKGASISLCIAEVLGTLVLLCHFFCKNASLRLCVKLPKWTDLRAFVKNGFGMGSAFIFQAIIMLVFNRLLLAQEMGVLYTAIFSVLYTVSTVPNAFYEGAGSSFAPVVPFFSGEKDANGIMTVRKHGFRFTYVVMATVLLLLLLFASPVVSFFGIEAESVKLSVFALRIFAISLVFAGINCLMTAFWQTVGRFRLASAMSVARNLAVILVAGILLISFFGIKGLAFAYLASEALCFVFAVVAESVSPSRRYVEQKYKPVGRVFEKYYTIKTESIAELATDLETLCDEWDMPMKKKFFLNFIAEEIILNLMKFAVGDTAKEHYVDMKLLENEDEYIFRIRDDVHTYNPFESDGDDVDNAVLGMIQKKSKYCEYRRKLVFNYLYLII